MFRRIRELLQGRARARYGTEQDVAPDANQSRTRRTGGVHHDEPPADAHTTTGPSESDVFVGRVAGQDTGYLDTGAEHRERQSERDDEKDEQ